jgi:hypothetical protein
MEFCAGSSIFCVTDSDAVCAEENKGKVGGTVPVPPNPPALLEVRVLQLAYLKKRRGVWGEGLPSPQSSLLFLLFLEGKTQ